VNALRPFTDLNYADVSLTNQSDPIQIPVRQEVGMEKEYPFLKEGGNM